MANYITVSAIGTVATALDLDPNLTTEESVRRHWVGQIEAVLPDRPDLIVLPELADVPRYFHRSNADRKAYFRSSAGSMLDDFATIAADNNCYIAYPTVASASDGAVYDSMLIIDRSGGVAYRYDKRQPTVEEHDIYGFQCCTGPQTIDLDFGRVGAAICFDLNFDEVMGTLADAEVRLVLFSSMFHGSFLQNYWAYRSRAYMIAAIHAPSPSQITSPVGETLARSTQGAAVTARLNLDYEVVHWDHHYDVLPKIKAKYGTGVTIHDPGLLGSVLITSESEDFTAADLTDEFGVTNTRDYFAGVRTHRAALGVEW